MYDITADISAQEGLRDRADACAGCAPEGAAQHGRWVLAAHSGFKAWYGEE